MQQSFHFYQLQAPGVLKLLPDTQGVWPLMSPEAGHILCQTQATALSPGTELSAYRGDPPLRPQAQVYPRLMGYCNVATIVARGHGVADHLQVGDRVITLQSHRSGFAVAQTGVLAKLPDGLDANTASVTYLFHLGYAAFLKSGAVQGDNAAVLGVGTLGLTVAAMFANGGVAMEGFTNHAPNVKTQQAFGLRAIHRKDSEDHTSRFDHVVVTTNGWDDWRLALELCRPGGIITVLSFPGLGQGTPDFNPLASQYFYDKQLTLKSCGYVPKDPTQSRRDQPRALHHNCQFLVEAIAASQLPAKSLIENIRAYTELDETYQDMLAGNRSALTTVLNWATESDPIDL